MKAGCSPRCIFCLELYQSGCAPRIYSGASTFPLFLNIVNDINSKVRLYTEDTGLFILVDNVFYAPRRSDISAQFY